MKTILVLAALLVASPALAAITQTKSLVSAVGVQQSAGSLRLSSNLGDVISGFSAGSTFELWHGFYGPSLALTSGVDDVPVISLRPLLSLPSPNPACAVTAIAYSLAVAEPRVSLAIYDVSGRLVRQLVSGAQSAGDFRHVWNLHSDNGTRVASGIYFVRLATRSFIQTRRITVLR